MPLLPINQKKKKKKVHEHNFHPFLLRIHWSYIFMKCNVYQIMHTHTKIKQKQKQKKRKKGKRKKTKENKTQEKKEKDTSCLL